jgi:hypothetical protein
MKGAGAKHFFGRIISQMYAESVKKALMRDGISASGAPLAGSGYDGAGGCAEEEPFGGAGDASPGAAAFGDADGVIALFGERGGLGFLVDKVALGG